MNENMIAEERAKKTLSIGEKFPELQKIVDGDEYRDWIDSTYPGGILTTILAGA